MPPNFNLLIYNQILIDKTYVQLESVYLTQCLKYTFALPLTAAKPFIFSCFVLSVDGKLCFPDLTSGFAIAKHNWVAKTAERDADWWSLLLARCISDALIIGSHSLNLEQHTFQAHINIPELQHLRKSLGKPKHLLHIILTRDIRQINLTQELLTQNNKIPLIIYTMHPPKSMPAHFKLVDLAQLNLTQLKQIVISQTLDIKKLIAKLYQLGINTILNESPFYHHQLQQLELLNEAWLNTSGIYIGGSISSLGQQQDSFKYTNHPHYTILTLHTLGCNFLYTRYQISYTQTNEQANPEKSAAYSGLR